MLSKRELFLTVASIISCSIIGIKSVNAKENELLAEHKAFGPLPKVMPESVFWSIIGKANLEGASANEQIVEPLVAALKKTSGQGINDFFEYLTRALFLIDTREHFKASGTTTDDTFLYARMAVLIHGKAFYEVVLNDPSQFPKNLWFEGFFGVADEAYAYVTGNKFIGETSIWFETGSNEAGWK